ncbi:MAG: PA domain-containing protein, partial [Rubricoccaceae bacterium]|nr:PA domain-containing protein [Rubricoccaceae bacterium]
MNTLRYLLIALALLAALPAGAQDPQEYPGLLIVSEPMEEMGGFAAGVCIAGHCLLPPLEGTGPALLIPGRDPGDPDGIPPSDPDEGCTPFTNGDEIAGNFVLIRAGGCTNWGKFYNAVVHGAVGVVLYHDETVGPDDDSTLVNIGWPQTTNISLPGLFISRYRGLRLLAAHDAGQEVVAEMRMNPDAVAAEPPAEAPPFALSVSPNPARGHALVHVAADRPLPS